MTVAVWFLYEFGDIVDCCWVTFADCHFFTQLFFLFMGGIGEFFEIRIFYPVKLSDDMYPLSPLKKRAQNIPKNMFRTLPMTG